MSPFEGSGASPFGGSATAAPPPNIPMPTSPASPLGGPSGGPPRPFNPPPPPGAMPPAMPPRPSFVPASPSGGPLKLDPLKPSGFGPLPPGSQGFTSPVGGPPITGGQDKLRKIILIIVFIAFLVVIGLIVLLVVGGKQDEQVDKQVSQPPTTDTNPTTDYGQTNQLPPLALSTDVERVAAVNNVKRALELYYRDAKQDPVVNGITAQDRWANLMGVLVTQGQLNEPIVDLGGAANYDYHARADGKAFVLSATLSDNFDQALLSDLDGLALGVNCDDPVFCVGYVK